LSWLHRLTASSSTNTSRRIVPAKDDPKWAMAGRSLDKARIREARAIGGRRTRGLIQRCRDPNAEGHVDQTKSGRSAPSQYQLYGLRLVETLRRHGLPITSTLRDGWSGRVKMIDATSGTAQSTGARDSCFPAASIRFPSNRPCSFVRNRRKGYRARRSANQRRVAI